MIIVTVGTQLPFDRLIEIMDELAPGLSEPVIAQTGVSTYRPRHIETISNVSPQAFEKYIQDARLIVSHAGIGTVLKAYKYRKPIILVPRLAKLGEHRNDHQLATVGELRKRVGIYIATSSEEMKPLLCAELEPAVATDDIAARRQELINFVASKL